MDAQRGRQSFRLDNREYGIRIDKESVFEAYGNRIACRKLGIGEKMEFKTVEKLPFDAEEAMNRRVSTRSFQNKALSDNERNRLMDFYQTLSNPFGVDVRVQHIGKTEGAGNVQLGTYGTIKGAKDFLAITVKDVPYAMEAAGYQFENLILYATQMGLGTVWLAATFSRKDFEKAMEMEKDDLFPCICPVGYPADKKSLIEKFTRSTLGSKKRKAWDKIFFNGDFSHRLTEAEAGSYRKALEMLRIAPSSTNGQPWAVVKEGNKFHFFNNYKNSTGEDMVRIKHLDLGIGLAHFHQAALQDGLQGSMHTEDITFAAPEEMHYILTYVAE